MFGLKGMASSASDVAYRLLLPSWALRCGNRSVTYASRHRHNCRIMWDSTRAMSPGSLPELQKHNQSAKLFFFVVASCHPKICIILVISPTTPCPFPLLTPSIDRPAFELQPRSSPVFQRLRRTNTPSQEEEQPIRSVWHGSRTECDVCTEASRGRIPGWQ